MALDPIRAKPRAHIDLLRAEPSVHEEDWCAASIFDPDAQLRQLAELLADGILSIDEFHRQRRSMADG
jgi:hypothetical protein